MEIIKKFFALLLALASLKFDFNIYTLTQNA